VTDDELREEPCGCKYHYDGAVPSQPATGRWDRWNRCRHHTDPADGLGDWIHVLHSMWPPPESPTRELDFGDAAAGRG